VYQFSDEDLSQKQFFRFSKKFVLNMNWALLPLAAKAVFPVVYAHDNGKAQAWPSEETIAALSGLSPKTVRKGINDLLAMAGFSFEWQITATGRKSKKFKFHVPSKDDRVFFFHKYLLTGGNWRMLNLVGKAVYPVLRTFSTWDKEEAEEDEDGILCENEGDYADAYAAREWEYSEIRPGDIAKYSGISRQRVFPALQDLQNHYLIERVGDRWKVFLIPPRYYNRDFLNEQLMKSFAYKRREEDGR
jgi:hypothetical protein